MTIQNPICDKLRNIFLYSLLDNDLRNFVGLNGISQFFEEGQGWYFWLLQKQGVYELELVSYNEKSSCLSADFLLRYYPHPEEEVFEEFSLLEQVIRLKYAFEDGCPASSCRKSIHNHCFYIGDVSILWHDEAILLSLQSQDKWVEYREKEIMIETPAGNKEQLVEKGGKDKNIPGWVLSWQYLDCLIKAACCISKAPPSLVTMKSFPGKVGYIDASGEITYKPSEFVLGRQLTVAILLKKSNMPDKYAFIKSLALALGQDFFSEARILFVENRDAPENAANCQFINAEWWEASSEGKRLFPHDVYI